MNDDSGCSHEIDVSEFDSDEKTRSGIIPNHALSDFHYYTNLRVTHINETLKHYCLMAAWSDFVCYLSEAASGQWKKYFV